MTLRPEAVVDASVALKWVFDQPASFRARALPASAAMVAPALLWTECANGLWRLARTVPALDAGHAFGVVSTVPVEVVENGLRLQTLALRLDGTLDHPICDCFCLALAVERGGALATADRRSIRVVARAAALPPDRPLTPPEDRA